MMQPRFERRVGNGPLTLVEQPRFRAGFDFLRLRAEAGEIDAAIAAWWEDFSLAGDEVRRDMLAELREHEHARRRVVVPAGDDSAPAASAAPRKRRRRRKPAGAPAAPTDGE